MGGLPAGFYRLRSGRIQWKVMVDGVRYSGSAPTLGEARRDRAQAELSAGARPTGDPTVADVVDAYLADLDVAPGTAEQLRRASEQLPEVFLARRCAEVTTAVVAALWRELDATIIEREVTRGGKIVIEHRAFSRHMMQRVRDLLSKAWQQAITWEWVAGNPFALVRPPAPEPAEEVQPPDPATVQRIIAAAGGRALALWLRLAAVIGARRGELCALQWRDVRLDVGEVVIRRAVSHANGELVEGRGKTRDKGHRVIAIDKPTIAALKRHRAQMPVGCPWVFSHDGVSPWRPDYVTREFARICGRLELAELHPHALRHFAATQWLAAGVPIPTVAYLLGHANPATTLRVYAHFIPAQARDAIMAHAAALDARSGDLATGRI